jgi:hypothetical protein
MDHRKYKKKLVRHQNKPCNTGSSLTDVFVGGTIWRQKQPHTSFAGVCVALTEFRFRRLRKHF